MASFRLIFLACAFVACSHAGAPLYNSHLDSVIPGEYIVKLKEGTTQLAANTLGHLTVLKEYNIYGWRALFVKIEDEHFGLLAEDTAVERIQANAESFHIAQECHDQDLSDHSGGLWGLRRSSHRDTSGENTYLHLDGDQGEGVTVYVLDTGIRTTHNDFEGRARFGFSSIPNQEEDGNGHGTHCAGTVAATTYGVAKAATVVSVKVLSNAGSGTVAQILAGIQYVADEHTSGAKTVMSMSLGMSSTNTEMREALEAVIRNGIHVVVAAGNSRADACTHSPAEVRTAITVGASDSSDSFASYSNHGECVDIVAPGSNVLSTWHLSDTATNTISGTSMACPHVAGWVARYLSSADGTPTPAQVMAEVQSTGTDNQLSGVPSNTINTLMFRAC